MYCTYIVPHMEISWGTPVPKITWCMVKVKSISNLSSQLWWVGGRCPHVHSLWWWDNRYWERQGVRLYQYSGKSWLIGLKSNGVVEWPSLFPDCMGGEYHWGWDVTPSSLPLLPPLLLLPHSVMFFLEGVVVVLHGGRMLSSQYSGTKEKSWTGKTIEMEKPR